MWQTALIVHQVQMADPAWSWRRSSRRARRGQDFANGLHHPGAPASRWLVTTTRPRTKCKRRVQVNLQHGKHVSLSKELLAQVVTPGAGTSKGQLARD